MAATRKSKQPFRTIRGYPTDKSIISLRVSSFKENLIIGGKEYDRTNNGRERYSAIYR